MDKEKNPNICGVPTTPQAICFIFYSNNNTIISPPIKNLNFKKSSDLSKVLQLANGSQDLNPCLSDKKAPSPG